MYVYHYFLCFLLQECCPTLCLCQTGECFLESDGAKTSPARSTGRSTGFLPSKFGMFAERIERSKISSSMWPGGGVVGVGFCFHGCYLFSTDRNGFSQRIFWKMICFFFLVDEFLQTHMTHIQIHVVCEGSLALPLGGESILQVLRYVSKWWGFKGPSIP